MPITPCQKEGKPGYKWGHYGVCFTGPGARSKAAEVGRAIHAQQQRIENEIQTMLQDEPPPSGGWPEKAKDILAAVYKQCRTDQGYGKERCARIAWGAVRRAGITKG